MRCCRRSVLAAAKPVDRQGQLCAACWQGIRFISEPCCARCGMPFSYDMAEETQCGACLRDPPPFAAARAAMVYDDASRGLILALKNDRCEGSGRVRRLDGARRGCRAATGWCRCRCTPGGSWRGATIRRRCWPTPSGAPAAVR